MVNFNDIKVLHTQAGSHFAFNNYIEKYVTHLKYKMNEFGVKCPLK